MCIHFSPQTVVLARLQVEGVSRVQAREAWDPLGKQRSRPRDFVPCEAGLSTVAGKHIHFVPLSTVVRPNIMSQAGQEVEVDFSEF